MWPLFRIISLKRFQYLATSSLLFQMEFEVQETLGIIGEIGNEEPQPRHELASG